MFKKKLIKTIVFLVPTGIVGFYALLLLAVVVSFLGYSRVYLFVAMFIYAELTLMLISWIWVKTWLKRSMKGFMIVLVLALGIGLGQGVADIIDNSYAVLWDGEVNLLEYQPFTSSPRVARLSEPSSLQMTDNLPRLDCATALYPLLAAFVEATWPTSLGYNPYNSGSLVQSTQTASAYQRLIDGDVELILAAGPSDAMYLRAEQNGFSFTMTPIGREAFVFFVNYDNPVSNLSVAQLQGIYSGEITNWQALGGKNEAIRAFQRNKNSGSQTALEGLMQGKQLMQAPIADVPSGMGGIISQTADYKNYGNAIGFSFRFYTQEMVKNSQIKLLSLEGVLPDKESIRDNAYPLASEFYAITYGERTETVQTFIDWMLSPQGQYLVEATGYVPVH